MATVETISASQDWVCPAGVTSVDVELWAGGGAGGGATGTASYAGGGAGGCYVKKTLAVTPTTTYAIVIGAGGVAHTTNTVPGGDSTFNATDVVAKGGAGAATVSGTTGAGAAGSTSGCVGDAGSIFKGGNGADGVAATRSGGGGGGAGSTGDGNTASSTAVTGGAAKSENGGAGGDGVTARDLRNNGGNYGGGGSGGCATNAPDRTGGNGGPGYCRLTYTVVAERRVFIIS